MINSQENCRRNLKSKYGGTYSSPSSSVLVTGLSPPRCLFLLPIVSGGVFWVLFTGFSPYSLAMMPAKEWKNQRQSRNDLKYVEV